MSSICELSKYRKTDRNKIELIKEVLDKYPMETYSVQYDYCKLNKMDSKEYYLCSPFYESITKYCPKCGQKYPDSENVCFNCLVHLKNISDKIDVSDIKTNPQFEFKASNHYDTLKDILSYENLLKIDEFDFAYDDYSQIIHDIKAQAFRNFDEIVKANEIDFDLLDILDKIILFTKSFVNVEYKSSGGHLGYFDDGIIYIDDRQTKSLQITTLIHELSHFLLKEIMIHILCKLLNANKNDVADEIITFILSYAPFTQLIDEYSAHNVEGRFTMFGFQDYSSYIQIERCLEGEMSEDEIEITKMIGNTFAVSIKDIIESLIDKPLREDIKEQFLHDVLDTPNYAALEMENCQILNKEGFVKAIGLILKEGCGVALNKLE